MMTKVNEGYKNKIWSTLLPERAKLHCVIRMFELDEDSKELTHDDLQEMGCVLDTIAGVLEELIPIDACDASIRDK